MGPIATCDCDDIAKDYVNHVIPVCRTVMAGQKQNSGSDILCRYLETLCAEFSHLQNGTHESPPLRVDMKKKLNGAEEKKLLSLNTCHHTGLQKCDSAKALVQL